MIHTCEYKNLITVEFIHYSTILIRVNLSHLAKKLFVIRHISYKTSDFVTGCRQLSCSSASYSFKRHERRRSIYLSAIRKNFFQYLKTLLLFRRIADLAAWSKRRSSPHKSSRPHKTSPPQITSHALITYRPLQQSVKEGPSIAALRNVKMRAFADFITVPSADTPGTLLCIHFDKKRYLLGNLAEGSSRACLQRGFSLKKVTDILLTGRTTWDSIGGMLGIVIGMADTKIAAADAFADAQRLKAKSKGEGGDDRKPSNHVPVERYLDLAFQGPPNLNYAIATARRFIFRNGMPLRATEHAASSGTPSKDLKDPTWRDENVQLWAIPVLPTTPQTDPPSRSTSARKRSIDQVNEQDDGQSSETTSSSVAKDVVKKMFDSDWELDRLVPQPLHAAKLPATLFVRDPADGQIKRYYGPLPGGDQPVPDIEVLVRQPWPGALTRDLPRTTPSQESLSYIIRSHPIRGKFLPEKAQQLKVMPKSNWGLLTSGQTVENADGRKITPDMVLEPGREGSGFVVADLPTVDYVDNFLVREELKNADAMTGVGAFIWILGPGVYQNAGLRSFMAETSGIYKHIVSGKDVCPDTFSIEVAAKCAWRHNLVDEGCFPKLAAQQTSPSVELETADGNGSPASAVVAAQSGLTLQFVPEIKVDRHGVVPPVNFTEVEEQSKNKLGEIFSWSRDPPSSIDEENLRQWAEQIPHGDAEIYTLGTGSSHPSTHRNVSGTLLRVPGVGCYLFDCGEGTMGTLRRLFPPDQLDAILKDLRIIWISHMHADHHLGTTSVIKAWYQVTHGGSQHGTGISKGDKRSNALAVVSEPTMIHWLREYSAVEDFGFSAIVTMATESARFSPNLMQQTTTELDSAGSLPEQARLPDFGETERCVRHLQLQSLSTVLVNHCHGAQAISITLPSGLKVSYSGDCRPSPKFIKIGQGSHVLIHEATLEDDMRSEAIAKKHSTAGEALHVAQQMGAKAVVLTHFSQRYQHMPPLGVPGNTKQSVQSPVEANGDGIVAPLDPQQEGDAPAKTVGQPLDAQQEDDAIEETDGQPIDAPDGVKSLSRPPTEDANETTVPWSLSNAVIIKQSEIAEMLASTGMKVIIAFDYMRVPIKYIPELERKQPVLRAIYDKLAEKDAKPPEALEAKKEGVEPSARMKKKESRKGKLEKVLHFVAESEKS